jgi:hypothetical protein
MMKIKRRLLASNSYKKSKHKTSRLSELDAMFIWIDKFRIAKLVHTYLKHCLKYSTSMVHI